MTHTNHKYTLQHINDYTSNYKPHMLHFHLPVQLTRWLAVQIPPLPDNLTFPPFEIQWKQGRWCPLDLPGWSTYTRHSCPGLQHLHLRQCRGIPRSRNQSWKWVHWNPSRCRHMCPPLPVTKEQSRQEGREQIHGYLRFIRQHDHHASGRKHLDTPWYLFEAESNDNVIFYWYSIN